MLVQQNLLGILLFFTLCLVFIYVVISHQQPTVYSPKMTSSLSFSLQKREEGQVPRKVCFTWKDRQSIPSHVWTGIHEACRGLDIEFFDDETVIYYLETHYGKEVVDHFHNLRLGAHKADLFRYAYLYREGGIYFDIKTKFVQRVEDMFPLDTPYLMCSVLSFYAGIYQGIIVTYPRNPIIGEALSLVLQTPSSEVDRDYFVFTQQLYRLFQNYLSLTSSTPLTPGWSMFTSPTHRPLLLYQEKCTQECKDKDRYGLCCDILEMNTPTTKDHPRLICYTRYSDFPW